MFPSSSTLTISFSSYLFFLGLLYRFCSPLCQHISSPLTTITSASQQNTEEKCKDYTHARRMYNTFTLLHMNHLQCFINVHEHTVLYSTGTASLTRALQELLSDGSRSFKKAKGTQRYKTYKHNMYKLHKVRGTVKQ